MNIADYLNLVLGFRCEVVTLPLGALGCPDSFGDIASPSAHSVICVVLLECEADAAAFLQVAANATAPLVIVTRPSLLYASATVRGAVAKLKHFMLIITGSKGGVSAGSPYEGMAAAVLDSVASKVGVAIAEGRVRLGSGSGRFSRR